MKRKYYLKDLEDYYNTNNTLPNTYTNISLYRWMIRNKDIKCVSLFLSNIGYIYNRSSYSIDSLINFYKTYNRLPKSTIKSERGLYDFMIKNSNKDIGITIFLEKIRNGEEI